MPTTTLDTMCLPLFVPGDRPERMAKAVASLRAPSTDELVWARSVLSAASHGGAAMKINGTMVDAPVVKRAEQIMRRAEAE